MVELIQKGSDIISTLACVRIASYGEARKGDIFRSFQLSHVYGLQAVDTASSTPRRSFQLSHVYGLQDGGAWIFFDVLVISTLACVRIARSIRQSGCLFCWLFQLSHVYGLQVNQLHVLYPYEEFQLSHVYGLQGHGKQLRPHPNSCFQFREPHVRDLFRRSTQGASHKSWRAAGLIFCQAFAERYR